MTAPVIAIVDDDVYIGDMLEELLRREGYGVLRAYSGTEALMLLEDRRRAGQADGSAVHRRLPGLRHENDPTVPQEAVLPGLPPQLDRDAGQELPGVEGLGQIVGGCRTPSR